MDDFFDALDGYVAAAKAKAQDLAEKGAAALEKLAEWVRSHSGPALIGATVSPPDTARLTQCLGECQALAAPVTGTAIGAGVGGPFSGLLAKILAAILAALK